MIIEVLKYRAEVKVPAHKLNVPVTYVLIHFGTIKRHTLNYSAITYPMDGRTDDKEGWYRNC